jgi:transcriptional regulator with XRE-family HTH domain
MGFDYSKLLGRIKEFGYTQESLAKEIGITVASMSLKLNNKANFKQREIRSICKVLKIPCGEIGIYFFTLKVRKTRTKEEEGMLYDTE